jgi:hypothetical protein
MLGLACPRRRPRVPRIQLSAGAKHRQRRDSGQRRIQIDPIRIGTLDQIDLLRGPPPPPDALFQWRASSTTDLDRPLRSWRGRRWPIQAADASPSPLFTTKAKPLSQGEATAPHSCRHLYRSHHVGNRFPGQRWDKPEDNTRGAGGVYARDRDCGGAVRGRRLTRPARWSGTSCGRSGWCRGGRRRRGGGARPRACPAAPYAREW